MICKDVERSLKHTWGKTRGLKMNINILDGNPQASRVVKAPFTEMDILYLQNVFTVPGVHTITVESVKEGRELIDQLLYSLDWYQDVAYLAASDAVPYTKALNILTKIEQPVTAETIAQFFIDEFYYDFLWIESNNSLATEPWIASFEYQLANFNIDHIIPIIIVLYA